jgi:hypothetical protein
MWGPDPPSEAALRQRLQKLRKLANTFPNAARQETLAVAQYEGLVTPTSSPKTPGKRTPEIEEVETTPRRVAKRRASQNVKYYVPEDDNSDDKISQFGVKSLDESDDESEWEPKAVTFDYIEDFETKTETIKSSNLSGEEGKDECEEVKEENESVEENSLDTPNQES